MATSLGSLAPAGVAVCFVVTGFWWGVGPALLAQVAASRLVRPVNRRLEAAVPADELVEARGALADVYRRSRHFDARLGAIQYARAVELTRLGRLEEALAAVEESIEAWRRLVGRRPHPHTGRLTGALGVRAVLLHGFDRLDDAIADLVEALALEETTKAPDRPWTAGRRVALAGYLLEAGRPAEALEPARLGAEFLREYPARDDEVLIEALDLSARALSHAGRPAEALAAQQELVGLLPQVEPGSPESYLPAAHLSHLALFLGDCDRSDEALVQARRSVEVLRRPDGGLADDWTAKKVLWNLAHICARLGRAEEATAAVRELAPLLDEERRRELGNRMLSDAEQLTALGELERARIAGELGVAAYRVLAEESPDRYGEGLRKALVSLLRTLDALGRDAEAARVRSELAGT